MNFKRINFDFCSVPNTEVSDECKYWDQFRHPINVKLPGRPSALKFAHRTANSLFVSSSTKLDSVDCRRGHLKQAGQFHNRVTCCDIRSDDAMIAGGDENGYLKIFVIEKRKALRRFKQHQLSVTDLKFSSGKFNLISCSQDLKLNVVDIATSETRFSYDRFKDKPSCLAVKSNTGEDHAFFCGSYDNTVRLFDTRVKHLASVVDHGHAIDAIKGLAEGNILASGGGRIVKIWDMRMPTEPVKILMDHHKHVMSIALNFEESRLLTSGIDRLVKVYTTDTFDCVHTITYPAPILALDISKDDQYLAVGLTDETISLKTKATADIEPGEIKYFSKRKRQVAEISQVAPQKESAPAIKHQKKNRLDKSEKLLRQFDQTEALKESLKNIKAGSGLEKMYATLFELERRRVLDDILRGLNRTELLQLLNYLHDCFCNRSMLELLTFVYEKILVLHGMNPEFSRNPEIRKVLKKTEQKLNNRLKVAEEMVSFASQFEMLESAMYNHYQDFLPESMDPGKLDLE